MTLAKLPFALAVRKTFTDHCRDDENLLCDRDRRCSNSFHQPAVQLAAGSALSRPCTTHRSYRDNHRGALQRPLPRARCFMWLSASALNLLIAAYPSQSLSRHHSAITGPTGLPRGSHCRLLTAILYGTVYNAVAIYLSYVSLAEPAFCQDAAARRLSADDVALAQHALL